MTIRESIIILLSKYVNQKFSANEITKLIIENNFYCFKKAKHPTKVVGSELSKIIKTDKYPLYVDRDRKPFLYFLKG